MPKSKTHSWDKPLSSTAARSHIKVTTAQIPVTGDIEANLANMSALIRDAAKQGVDVVHSCASDNVQRDRIEAHVIQPLLRRYAWLHGYAVSSSNSCRPSQNFSSFRIERSDHMGRQAPKDAIGFAINDLVADEEQDAFFRMVRDFRMSAREHEHT